MRDSRGIRRGDNQLGELSYLHLSCSEILADAARNRLRRSRKNPEDPRKKICTDLITIDPVEHFVSSTRITIMGDINDTRCAISREKDPHGFELVADGILAARKYIDGQIVADLAKTDRIGQLGGRGEKRFARRRL